MIHIGDALTVLRTMPDESVHCIVTSPPYWGLRDYGTGTWEGGDPQCDHREAFDGEARNAGRDRAASGGTFHDSPIVNQIAKQYRDICGKCGARRVDQQLGLERTPEEYLAKMVAIFREARRVLRSDGTCWVNMGDSYASNPPGNARPDHSGPNLQGTRGGQRSTGATLVRAARSFGGLKPKDLCGIPWRLALALQADGWWLRSDVIERVKLYCPCGCGFELEEYVRPAQDRDIVWEKPNPMPESVTDRPTKAHEYVFLLSKSARYFYDAAAVRERREGDEDAVTFRGGCYVAGEPGKRKQHGNKVPAGWDTVDHGRAGNGRFTDKQAEQAAAMPRNSHHVDGFNARWDSSEEKGAAPMRRNARSVWTIATQPFPEAHFATFPEALAERCIRAGCPEGATVLDPFGGAGTTGLVAAKLNREWVLIELKPEYAAMAERRIRDALPLFAEAVK